MLLPAIQRFDAYNTWATEQIFSTYAGLTPDQFNAAVVPGQPPLRDTLVHRCAAQRVHLDWWNGTLSGADSWARPFAPEDYPNFEAVRAFWHTLAGDTAAFVATRASDADLERILTRTTDEREIERPLWESMPHVVNHGTQHRSETALMLTALGYSPGDLDLL